MFENTKALRVSSSKGFKTEITTTGIAGNFVFHNATKTQDSQRFCKCGEVISRDDIIFENRKVCRNCEQKELEITKVVEMLVTTPAKAVKAVHCEGCKKLTPQHRLVLGLPVCRQCLNDAQTKAIALQNLFIRKVIANAQRALQYRVRGGALYAK